MSSQLRKKILQSVGNSDTNLYRAEEELMAEIEAISLGLAVQLPAQLALQLALLLAVQLAVQLAAQLAAQLANKKKKSGPAKAARMPAAAARQSAARPGSNAHAHDS